ncbi:6,7-dimethyl-8-ribityllumazine synthase [Brevibacterium casei]|uniref:6,7-dimethyl-8-ribityllumazine synthase n=2 Tax=Brevibacterium casei TaxID=33889 RepID=K9AHI8_9MICO|nr:6,7-dimethyl-8-ribityllumazine synthase [Brevibacterium casei]SIG82565.1 6,7-dimethyl-8-ribityllumazine synthase [Mycobacteroides abscessus subsp. abscessus]EKU46749.1 6,7-dimethyl-8-ribityllumazine synthase [Brevibacterium casei S18]MBE4694357.1 6,7-dimethyl-8-ribityllumazine synthase [Brevibacterium casei]MBY3577479.1 6,7-dimethyl-8-ribityllumazine synthase [Brevibacterium casei]MCT1448848.1 6,7-dimethyl-8-ribityllumazine synthase [Brevibacterium casei]
MAHSGAPDITVTAGDFTVAIIAASWHTEVMDGLIAGAERAAADAGAQTTLIRVPGSFELAVAAARVAKHFDAVVALGVVIRGGTPHFDYVCSAATDGLNRVALDSGKPVGFGVLTCDNDEQARDRAGLPGSREDKGHEAMTAALATASALKDYPLG